MGRRDVARWEGRMDEKVGGRDGDGRRIGWDVTEHWKGRCNTLTVQRNLSGRRGHGHPWLGYLWPGLTGGRAEGRVGMERGMLLRARHNWGTIGKCEEEQ